MTNEAFRLLKHENLELREENRALLDELRQLRTAIEVLTQFSQNLPDITSETDAFALIGQILVSALDAVASEDGSLLLLDEEKQELVFVASASSSQPTPIGMRIPADAGIVGSVVVSGQPRLVHDVRLEPLWTPMVDEQTGFQTTSLMCVPVFAQGRVTGALEVVNKRHDRLFDEQDLNILLLVAHLAGLALTRAEQSSPA